MGVEFLILVVFNLVATAKGCAVCLFAMATEPLLVLKGL
jgi:hypothetical protein